MDAGQEKIRVRDPELERLHLQMDEANRRGEPGAILPTLYDWDDRVLGLDLRKRASERASEKLSPELQALLEERDRRGGR